MKEKTSIWKLLGAISTFWLIFLFGGSLIFLIQQIGIWFYGSSEWIAYILEKWVSVVANPLACIIGAELYSSITEGNAKISLIVNLVIAAVLSALTFIGILLASPIDVIRAISTALTVIACIYCICSTTKKLRQ